MYKDFDKMDMLYSEGRKKLCLASLLCYTDYGMNLEIMLKYFDIKFSMDLLALKYDSWMRYEDDFESILWYIISNGYTDIIWDKDRTKIYEYFNHIPTDVIDWLLNNLQQEPCMKIIIEEMHQQYRKKGFQNG